MKLRHNRSTRSLTRTLIIGAAGAAISLSHTSCGGLGLGKQDDAEDPAIVDASEPTKKKRGSLFSRAKNRNSWIDEDIQTTRRDHYARQSQLDFTLPPAADSNFPAPASAPATEPSTAPQNAGTPDPAPNTSRPQPAPLVSGRSTETTEPLRLPGSLDDDFPQPKLPAAAPPVDRGSPSPAPAEPLRDEDGYILLQPKLPGAESIEPPKD